MAPESEAENKTKNLPNNPENSAPAGGHGTGGNGGGSGGGDLPPEGDQVLPVNIEQEMKVAYLDYAMSVIIGRALPDVRDGLKPAHRRVLFAMFREGLLSNKRYSKCAGVVGEVLKKYHPHGDTAVYDTLVRMAQPWNMRYPLIDGQGNFGSVDGDSAAAYRYTEARLTRLAEELLADIDKETVDFAPNFDGSTEEPTVLPSKFPNLLVNGSSGIAVGMATNIAPHNLNEVVEGLIRLIDAPDATLDELIKIIPGPDFPTAGIIFSPEALLQAYRTGRGIVPVRGRAVVEPIKKKDREQIVITEIPYQVNKAKLVEKIAELVNEKKIEGISDLRDESDRQGMRVVVELKRDVDGQIVLNQLFKHTPLQSSFGVNMVAIVNGQPKTLNLREMLEHFLTHRKEIIARRTIFELRKAEHEAHILEGLKIALDHLDAIIALIRSAKSPQDAKAQLVSKFHLTEVQAQAILDMRLARLTALERDKILEEYMKLMDLIKELKAILADEKKIFKIIRDELTDIRERFGDDRRTEILAQSVSDINVEDLIQEEDMVVTISHAGYIKRNPVHLYRRQKRGGKGVMGMGVKEEDFVANLFIASTHSYLMFFTAKGRVYWLKVHEIPEAGRTAKGKAVVNLLSLKDGDRVTAVLPVREFKEGHFILQSTRQGVVKKTDLMAYAHPRPGGIIAITLDDGDELMCATITDGKKDIFIGTHMGMSIRFNEEDARAIGRASRGVRGIQLEKGDFVVGMEVFDKDAVVGSTSILTVTERGYSKRTDVSEYRVQGRAGSGVINLKTTDRVGNVMCFVKVQPDEEIMVITDGGTLIRTPVSGIPVQGRNTQGVRTISVSEGEKVIGIAKMAETGEEGNGDVEPTAPENGSPAE